MPGNELREAARGGIRACQGVECNYSQSDGLKILFREILSLHSYWSSFFGAELDAPRVRVFLPQLVGAVESAARLVGSYSSGPWLLSSLRKLENRDGFLHAAEIVWRYVEVLQRQLGSLDLTLEKRRILARLEEKVGIDKKALRCLLEEAAGTDRMELKFKVETERSSRMRNLKLFVQGGRKIMLDALSQKLDSTERIYFIDPRSLLLSGIVLGDANSLVQKGNWLGQAVAVKKCGDGFRYSREAGVFQNFQPSHPNVIQVLGESEVPETKEKLLVMEEKDSDLKRYFHSSGPITQLQAVDFLIQIAGAMVYLHGKGVCYRDLKLENIMIDVRYLELTLADFGHSKPRFDPLGDNTCPVGTVSYMAPEVLAGITSGQDPGYGFSVDVFSFGIACSEIVSGQPLELTVPLTREERIERLRRGERPSLPESCHQKLKQLITQCWDFSPKKRPTFEVIYEKLWEIKEELLAGSPASTDPGEAAPAFEIQAPGIQNLAITGANTVGSKSTATWEYVNETTFCVVGWQRYRDLESEEPQLSWELSLTSGTSSDYTITPDDLDRHIGVICLPLALVDGKIVPRQQARFTHGALVSQDLAMAREMERHLRKEHVAFDITVDRRKIKLNLCHTDYHLVWHMGSTKNFRGQFVRGDVSVEVVGDCSMVISKASQSQRSTIDFKDSYRRNLAVLLIRHFLESSPSQNGLDHIPTRNTW